MLCAEDMVGYILPRETLGPHLEYLHPPPVRILFHNRNTETSNDFVRTLFHNRNTETSNDFVRTLFHNRNTETCVLN